MHWSTFALPFAILLPLGVFVLWMVVGRVIAGHFLGSDHHQFDEVETPSDRGFSSEPISIPVSDDHDLAGWILRPGEKESLGGACVVMVHGYDSGKDKVWTFPEDPTYRASMLDQGAESLCRAGFIVVAIDLRNHGDSGDCGPVTLGATESDDVLATVHFLQEQGHLWGIDPRRIGLRGESMGGAASCIAAARDDDAKIAALWIDSAFACASTAITDFITHAGVPRLFGPSVRFWLRRMTGVPLTHSSPLEFVDRISCPVCVVHSEGDRMVPVWHYHQLTDSRRWKNEPESWLLTRHDHNRLWREPTYHRRQIEFFRQHLIGESNEDG